MSSSLQPLDRRLLSHRRGALTFAGALAGFVALCWIVIQLHGSFPGDGDLISWMRDPHPGEPLALFAPGNFPSGHVVYITSLCGLLGWFALARGHRATSVTMLLLILAMGPLRVVDGAHWPSDVLAGYALGLAWTIAVLVIGLPWAAGIRHREDHPAQPGGPDSQPCK
jgi:hypothetical protein